MAPRGCANCQADIGGRFCPHCGQRDRSYRESFWKLAGEIVREAFEVDGRIPRTLLPFFFRPGLLVEEYNAGRRVHYSSPLRVYLFTLVVGFLALSFAADRFADSITDTAVDTQTSGEAIEPAPSSSTGGMPVDSVDRTTPSANATNEETARPRLSVSVGNNPVTVERQDDEPWTRAFHRALRKAHDSGDEQLPPAVLDKLAEFERMGDDLAMQQILRSLLDLAPKVVSALVPVFAGLLMLVYMRQPLFFVEHLVFSLNLHALGLVVLSVSALIGSPLSDFLPWALPLHLLLGMRRVYGQSWLWTSLKFGFLALTYSTIVLLAFLGVMLGALWFA